MASTTKSPLKSVLSKNADVKPSSTVGVAKPVAKTTKPALTALNVKKTTTTDTEIQKKTSTVSKSPLSNKISPPKIVKAVTVSPSKPATKSSAPAIAAKAIKTPAAPSPLKETPKSSLKVKTIDSQKLVTLKVNLSSKFSSNENVKSSPKSPVIKAAPVSKTTATKTDISKTVSKSTTSSGQLSQSKEIAGKIVKPTKVTTPIKATTVKTDTTKLGKNDTANKKTIQRAPSTNSNSLKSTKILTKSSDSKTTKSQTDLKARSNKENIKVKSLGKDIGTKPKKGDLIIIKCNFDETKEDYKKCKNQNQDLIDIISEEKINLKLKNENFPDSESKSMEKELQENPKKSIFDLPESTDSTCENITATDNVEIVIQDESPSSTLAEDSLQSSTISSSYYQDYVKDIEPTSYTMHGQVVFGYDETDESYDEELSTINEENEISVTLEHNQQVQVESSCSEGSCDSDQFEIVDSTFEVEKEEAKKNDDFVVIDIESSNKQLDNDLMMDQKYIYFVKEELSCQQNSNQDQIQELITQNDNTIFVTTSQNLINFNDDKNSTNIIGKNECDENIVFAKNEILTNDNEVENSVENNFIRFDGQAENNFPLNFSEDENLKNNFVDESANFLSNSVESENSKNNFFEGTENFSSNLEEGQNLKNNFVGESANFLSNSEKGENSQNNFFEGTENFSSNLEESKNLKNHFFDESKLFLSNSNEGKTCTKIDLFQPSEINVLTNLHENNIETFEPNFDDIDLSLNFEENNPFFNNNNCQLEEFNEKFSQDMTAVKKIFLMNVESISKYIKYNNPKCTGIITYNDLLSNVGQSPTYAEILMRSSNQKTSSSYLIPKCEKKSHQIFLKCNKENYYKNLSMLKNNDNEENLPENDLTEENEINTEEEFTVICRKKPRKTVVKSTNIEEIISEESSSDDETNFIQDIPHIMKFKKQKKMKIQFNKKNVLKRLNNNKAMKNGEIFTLPMWKSLEGM